MGTEMLEIDCQITSDGEVVVTHDNHLSRTTGSPVDVSETAYKVMFVNHVIMLGPKVAIWHLD